jgi:hypothetical protein
MGGFVIINLNNEDVQWDAKGKTVLGDLLEDFVAARFFKDEFIATITVNGTRMSETDMLVAKDTPVSEVASLRITSDTFRNVSVNALESIGEYLDGLSELIKSSAEHFRMAGEPEANAYFVKCLDGLQTFVGIIDKVKNINSLDFQKINYKSTTISKKEASLLESLNSIYETQSKKDWVSMADMLEFELSPLIIEWKEILLLVTETLKKP